MTPAEIAFTELRGVWPGEGEFLIKSDTGYEAVKVRVGHFVCTRQEFDWIRRIKRPPYPVVTLEAIP